MTRLLTTKNIFRRCGVVAKSTILAIVFAAVAQERMAIAEEEEEEEEEEELSLTTEDDDYGYPEEIPAAHPGPETSPITEDDDEESDDEPREDSD